jgi:predicted transcriptional regulator
MNNKQILKKKEKAIQRTITIYPDVNQKLTKIANKYNTSRSRILEYLIVNNYDELMNVKKKR